MAVLLRFYCTVSLPRGAVGWSLTFPGQTKLAFCNRLLFALLIVFFINCLAIKHAGCTNCILLWELNIYKDNIFDEIA